MKTCTKKAKVVFIADERALNMSFVEAKFCRPRQLANDKLNYIFFSLQRGLPRARVVQEIRSVIRGASAVFFDYGGFSLPSSNNHSLIGFYTREFIKIIRDHPSIEWWCTSALPNVCFSDEEKNTIKSLGVNIYWQS
ncbi:MAG: hypothetical protein ACYS1A_20450 [Planctomycetota bacterium]|jgi:hypothetical protein